MVSPPTSTAAATATATPPAPRRRWGRGLPALYRMLLRDLWRFRGQALAACLVIACGVASVVGMMGTGASLSRALQQYYATQNFADLFLMLKRAPEPLAQRVLEWPGVASVQTRVITEGLLLMPGLAEPAAGRFISLPDPSPQGHNRLYLRAGRLPEPGLADEVVASEAFASAHGLRPGDSIQVLIAGRQRNLQLVGVALSPEYIYELPPGGMLPDKRRFGVFWMPRDALAGALDLKGSFNALSLRLLPGASVTEVKRRLDALFAPQGGLGAYARDEQLSHRFVRDELRQIRMTSTLFPLVFFGVAIFLLHVIFTRLVQLQRADIGLLKAFGYSSFSVGAHYLRLSCVAISPGLVLGVGAGVQLGEGFVGQYRGFYLFPALVFQAEPRVVALALLGGLMAAVLGVWSAVLQAVRLPPALAMRPPSPAQFRPGWLERAGLLKAFNPSLRMIWRQLARRPWKAAASGLAIACAAALLVAGSYSLQSIRQMIRLQFEVVQREQLTVVYRAPLGAEASADVASLPGVLRVEPFRAVAVRLRAGAREQSVSLMGLSDAAELRRLVDNQARPMALPETGVVLTRQLAETLQLQLGDEVDVEILEGRRGLRQLRLTAYSDEALGVGASLRMAALNALLDEAPGVASGAYLRVDALQTQRLYEQLKQLPVVASVMAREPMLQSIHEVLERTVVGPALVNVVFACVIAFGVVYNSVRMALSERGHELASLRVLGFTQREVAAILLGEQALIVLLSLPLGGLLGWLLCIWFAHSMSSDLFRLPWTVQASSYGFGASVILLASSLCAALVARRLARLDLIAVLKTRE